MNKTGTRLTRFVYAVEQGDRQADRYTKLSLAEMVVYAACALEAPPPTHAASVLTRELCVCFFRWDTLLSPTESETLLSNLKAKYCIQ